MTTVNKNIEYIKMERFGNAYNRTMVGENDGIHWLV